MRTPTFEKRTKMFFFPELKKHVEDKFNEAGFIASESKAGKWLVNYVEKQETTQDDLYEAARYFSNKEKQQRTANTGTIAAYLFDQQITPNYKEEKQVYKALYAEIHKEKEQMLTAYEALKTTQEEKIQAQEKQLKAQQKIIDQFKKDQQTWNTAFQNKDKALSTEFLTLRKTQENEFKTLRENHETAMQEKEAFYEKKLAVKSAVEYWRKKAKKHRRIAISFGILAGVLMLVSIVIFYRIGVSILNLDAEADITKRIITETGSLQLWVYGLFTISATLAIWIIRLLVKIFLSNLHLSTDAEERETMIQTYLAFEREENVLKETDKEHIIPAIFRSTATGIVKDDGSPQSPLNIIMKKFSD